MTQGVCNLDFYRLVRIKTTVRLKSGKVELKEKEDIDGVKSTSKLKIWSPGR